jgi:hypothetical protein
MSKKDDEIIKEEIDAILVDLKEAYEKSGRKASGQFAEGLEAVYEPNKGTIRGYTYLAGRGATKKKGKAGEPTLREQIFRWLITKGIRPRQKKMKLRSLAYIIARKIHKSGTDRGKWFNIYEEVITASRINKIIDRIGRLNVNRLITEINAELEILAKNV